MPEASAADYGAPAGHAGGPLRVLLVGGKGSGLEGHATLLEQAAFSCRKANAADEAIESLATFTPDLVIIDSPLEGVDAAGLAARIRATAAIPEVSTLLLSTPGAEDLAACVAVGADFVFAKPLDPSLFTAIVRSRAARARRLKEQHLQLAAALREVQYRQAALDAHAVVSMTDSAGNIVYANEKLTELSGYSQAELLGRNHRLFKSGRHAAPFYADMWRTITAGEVWQGAICNRHKDGGLYWVQATVMPLREAEGLPQRYISVQTDITHLVLREGLAEAEARLLGSTNDREEGLAQIVVAEIDQLLPDVQAAIQLFDPERQALRLAVAPSLAPEHGRALADLGALPGLTPCAAASIRGEEVHIADMASHREFRQFCDLALAAGLRASWSAPIRTAAGPILGTLTLYLQRAGQLAALELEAGRRLARIAALLISRLHDAGALSAAERELRRAKRRADLALDGARLGYWDVDIESGKGIVNRRWHDLLGYDAAEVDDNIHARWLDRLHPDDRARTLEVGRRYKNGEIAEYEVEYRVLGRDGETRWLSSRGAAIERGGDGRPLRIAGVCQDITPRRQAEERAEQQAKLLALLQRGMQDYLTRGELVPTAEFLLRGVIELTGSEYGFTGEILRDGDGAPYLKTHVLANIAWDDATRRLYAEETAKGLEFRNLNTLFGAAIVSGKAVISNDPAHDPRHGGLPAGHPPLHAFLAIPVHNGAELVALYGLANRPGGYEEAWIDLLAPFDATYAAIVAAHRQRLVRQELVDALKAAKGTAEAANRAKSAFLASMSHELRTPLNAILGYAQLIEMDESLQGHRMRMFREGAHEIQQAGQHLLALINDLLDLARIEAGRVRVTLAPVCLEPLLRRCEAMAMAVARQKSVGLRLAEASCRGMHVLADDTRLKQVVLNLLSNAIKYNRPGGTVEMSCARQGEERVRILICDTGPGIPPDKQTRLFTAFERLGAERTAIEGTGIGLVISKHLVDMMAGHIGLESRVGEGSTFWVELPLYPTPPEVSAVSDEETPIASGKTKTVLHIEDNPINIMLIGDILAAKPSLRLLSARSAEEGLELARQHVPDLILLDIRLPGMDGYAALAQLRQMKALAGTPIIAVTASATPADTERGLAAGFTGFISKPLDITRFLDLIDDRLGGHD